MGDTLIGMLVGLVVFVGVIGVLATIAADTPADKARHTERVALVKACNDKGGTASVLHVGYDELLQCTLPKPVPAKQ